MRWISAAERRGCALNVEGLLSLRVSSVPGCRGHRLTGQWGRKYTCFVCLYGVNCIILAESLNLREGSQLEEATMDYFVGWEMLRKVGFCLSFRKQEGNRIYKVCLCEWDKASSNQWLKKAKCSSCNPLCFVFNAKHSRHFIIQSPLDSLSLLFSGNTTPPSSTGCNSAFELMKAQWVCITSVHSESRNLAVCGEGSCGVTKTYMSLPDSVYFQSVRCF